MNRIQVIFLILLFSVASVAFGQTSTNYNYMLGYCGWTEPNFKVALKMDGPPSSGRPEVITLFDISKMQMEWGKSQREVQTNPYVKLKWIYKWIPDGTALDGFVDKSYNVTMLPYTSTGGFSVAKKTLQYAMINNWTTLIEYVYFPPTFEKMFKPNTSCGSSCVLPLVNESDLFASYLSDPANSYAKGPGCIWTGTKWISTPTNWQPFYFGWAWAKDPTAITWVECKPTMQAWKTDGCVNK